MLYPAAFMTDNAVKLNLNYVDCYFDSFSGLVLTPGFVLFCGLFTRSHKHYGPLVSLPSNSPSK